MKIKEWLQRVWEKPFLEAEMSRVETLKQGLQMEPLQKKEPGREQEEEEQEEEK